MRSIRWKAILYVNLLGLAACGSADSDSTADAESRGDTLEVASGFGDPVESVDVPFIERPSTNDDWPIGGVDPATGDPTTVYVFEDGVTVSLDPEGLGRVSDYEDCGETGGAYVVAAGGRAGPNEANDGVIDLWVCM